MAERDVVKHYLRLNLQNEQHLRIQKVLANLNKDIHKSENQFIIKAIDFYIQSFENGGIIDGLQHKYKPEYVTEDDIANMRREIENSMKDELIRLLGSALMGNSVARETVSRAESVQEIQENNPIAVEAANLWG